MCETQFSSNFYEETEQCQFQICYKYMLLKAFPFKCVTAEKDAKFLILKKENNFASDTSFVSLPSCAIFSLENIHYLHRTGPEYV